MALAHDANTMSGATFHYMAMILLMSGWYFAFFLSLVSSDYISLQYVNSMNCMMIFGVGSSGGEGVVRVA